MVEFIEPGPRRVNICCGAVLFDSGTGNTDSTIFTDALRRYYVRQLGLRCHQYQTVKNDPNFNLDDYGLIHLVLPRQNPDWWADRLNWNPCFGPKRIAVSGDYDGQGSYGFKVRDTINAMGLGMTIGEDIIPNGGFPLTVIPHQLNTAVTQFTSSANSRVNGGNRLSEATNTEEEEPRKIPWLAQNKVGEIDYVLDGTPSIWQSDDNNKFFKNLWRVKP